MADRVDLNIDGTNYSIPEFAYDRSIQELIKAVNQLASRNQSGFKKLDTQAKTLESILNFFKNEAKTSATKNKETKVEIDTTAIEQELQNLVAQNKDLVSEAKSDSSVLKTAISQLISDNKNFLNTVDSTGEAYKSAIDQLVQDNKSFLSTVDSTGETYKSAIDQLVQDNKSFLSTVDTTSEAYKSAIDQLVQDNKSLINNINAQTPEKIGSVFAEAIGSSFDDLASKLQQSINQQSSNQPLTQKQDDESSGTPQTPTGAVSGFENTQIIQMLERIAVATEKTAGITEKESKPQQASNDNNKEELKAVKQALDSNTKANKGMIGKLMDTLGGKGGVLGGVIGGFAKFGRLLNPATAAIAGLISGLKAAFKFLMRLGRLENTIFRRGFNEIADATGPNAGVADGIATFAARAADASLSLDQFIELSGEFATVMGEYGTKTVTDAIQNTQGLLREQGYLGLSNQELSQATVETAEAMRILGFDLEGNNKQISDNTVRVLRTTQAFTRLTNTSNDVIRQMVLQASAIESFTNALQMLPSDLRQSALASSQTAFAGLAAFGPDLGQELTTALSEGIGRGGLQFTQFGQDLARVSPGLLQSLQNLSYEAGRGGNVVGALDDFRETIGTVDANSRQFLRALEISGDPMAKFVIRLANLNETVDDNTFAEMVKTMSEIDAGALGRAQNQMALALAKIRTAFTKVALAFLNEDTVNGFQFLVDKFTGAVESVADWLKGPGFQMINEAFTGITNYFADLFSGRMTFWEALTRAFGGIFNGLGDILERGIGAGIMRGVASVTPLGYSAEDFESADEINSNLQKVAGDMRVLKKSQSEIDPGIYQAQLDELKKKEKELLLQLTDISGVDLGKLRSDPNFRQIFTGPDGNQIVSLADATNEQLRQYLTEEMGRFGYNFNQSSASGSLTQADTGTGTGTQQTDGAIKPDSNIKIMPMFGNPDDYTKREKTTEEIIAENTKKASDILDNIARMQAEQLGETKKGKQNFENWVVASGADHP